MPKRVLSQWAQSRPRNRWGFRLRLCRSCRGTGIHEHGGTRRLCKSCQGWGY